MSLVAANLSGGGGGGGGGGIFQTLLCLFFLASGIGYAYLLLLSTCHLFCTGLSMLILYSYYIIYYTYVIVIINRLRSVIF